MFKSSQICPVCSGNGKILDEQQLSTSSTGCWTKKCHGCDGRGWIEVGKIKRTSFDKWMQTPGQQSYLLHADMLGIVEVKVDGKKIKPTFEMKLPRVPRKYGEIKIEIIRATIETN